MRIGIGFDVHAFAEGRRLVLGGVAIPYDLGLLGHSDADVIVHAIMDAILGALALGDIGKHFPDNDAAYKDIDSLQLLKKVNGKIKELGYKVGNIDSVIIAEKPKLLPYIPLMREKIAGILGITSDQVSVKATTTEKLGFIGRQEGIAAQAVCLIMKNN